MSLFGSNNSTAGKPAGGLGFSFGGQQNTQQNQQNQQNQQPQQQQPQFGQQQQQQPAANSTALTMQSSGFEKSSNLSTSASSINPDGSSGKVLKDLLESASNLPKLDNVNVGSIHLPLNELQTRTQLLRRKERDLGGFTKAHYLLSGSGINAGDIEMELKNIRGPPATLEQRKKEQQEQPHQQRQSQFQQLHDQQHQKSALLAQQVHQLSQEQQRHELTHDQQSLDLASREGLAGERQLSRLDGARMPVSSGQAGKNIESFLSAKKDENILNAIELSLLAASRDFDNFITKNISIDWKVRKDHLKKSLGIPVRTKISQEELSKSFTWNQTQPGNYRILTPLKNKSASSSVRQLTREKFESHAKIVYLLNEARLKQQPFPVALSFEELNKANLDLKSKQLAEAWRIIASLANEKFVKLDQEQAFFSEYQSKTNESQLKKRIVLNSKSCLEKQFFDYMDESYTKDDEKLPDHRVPSNINKVSHFITKIIAKNSDAKFLERTLQVNGVPIWALVYYLMRSGLYSEAVQLADSKRELFDKFDKNFPIYISSYVKNECCGLPSDLQERLASDFNQTFQFLDEKSPNFDPYKYAVYKVIGKCVLAKKSLPAAVNLSIEDWLWFHLSLINEFNYDASSSLIYENYRLENLQKKVLSLGPTKFNASSNNPLYLKTLILLGLYELAVKFAYETINECDAVHLAIGLCYYGLLRVSGLSNDDLLAINSSDQHEINFSRLLGSYTRTFKISDPKVTVQYLILICMAKGGKCPEETAKCHEALRELILISREFTLLLGELNDVTGEKLSGILEKQRSLINLSDLAKFQRTIIDVSASRCEEEGRVFDALLLYQLSQDYDVVVRLINEFVGETLSMSELDKPLLSQNTYRTPSGNEKPEQSIENNFILLSKHVMGTFNNNSSILGRISPAAKKVNDALLEVVDIRESFAAKNWEDSLTALQKLPFLASLTSDDFVAVRNSAESLTDYDVSLLRVVPSLLVMVMTSVAQLTRRIKDKQFGSVGNEKDVLANLRKIAKNCMVYAGLIQYRMPRETYSLLVNLELQL